MMMAQLVSDSFTQYFPYFYTHRDKIHAHARSHTHWEYREEERERQLYFFYTCISITDTHRINRIIMSSSGLVPVQHTHTFIHNTHIRHVSERSMHEIRNIHCTNRDEHDAANCHNGPQLESLPAREPLPDEHHVEDGR